MEKGHMDDNYSEKTEEKKGKEVITNPSLEQIEDFFVDADEDHDPEKIERKNRIEDIINRAGIDKKGNNIKRGNNSEGEKIVDNENVKTIYNPTIERLENFFTD